MIASDENGTISPDAAGAAAADSAAATSPRRRPAGSAALLDPSAVRLAPRAGFALTLDDCAGGHSRRLRHLPEPVGLQRADGASRATCPSSSRSRSTCRSMSRVPTLQTRDILTSNATGTIGATIMDYAYAVEYSQTWSGGIQHELLPTMMVEVSYMGTWTLGADNATDPQRARARPGAIQPRRPIPQLSRINAIRFDGKSIYHGVDAQGRASARRTTTRFDVSYTLSTSKDDASSPEPTESEANVPQDVRNIFDETGEWALSSFDHRHQFVASGVLSSCRSSRRAGGVKEAVLGDGASTRICHGAVGRAVHGQPRRRSREHRRRPGAAPRSAPRSEPARRRAHARTAGSTRRRLRCRRRSPSAARPRNSVIGPGLRATSTSRIAKTWRAARRLAARVPVGDLQPASTARTSTSPTEPSGRRTSAASSAPGIRVRCSSASSAS